MSNNLNFLMNKKSRVLLLLIPVLFFCVNILLSEPENPKISKPVTNGKSIKQNSTAASELRILFTSSLDGNLDGCTCKVAPLSGLVKRFTWINNYKKNHKDTVLLDTGNLISSKDSRQKAEFIFNVFKLQGYSAIVPGSGDLSYALPFLEENKMGLKYIGNSTKVKNIAPYLLINKNGMKIAVIGYTSTKTFEYMPISKSDAGIIGGIGYLKDQVNLAKEGKPDFIIVLAHAPTDEAHVITEIEGVGLVIVGYERIIPKTESEKKHKNKYVLQAGGDGEHVGEVILAKSEDGNVFVKKDTVYTMYDEKPVDEPEIRNWINAHPEY